LPLLQRHFDCPILLNEHFKLWLLAESTIGGLINDDDVIFLQLGENINLSILLKGALLNQQSRMNVDKMSMPKFSALSDEIAENCDEIERYQLTQQVTLPQVAKLVDRYLPNQFTRTTQKINLLCEQIKAKNPQALQILQHISDNLSYVLMNLINIFSSKKIMFNSPLLQVQEELFEQITQKLKQHLLRDDLDFQLTTAQIAWNSPLIPCSAIKQGIYEGVLLKEGI
jgi:transcriptional regulator of PTS gene